MLQSSSGGLLARCPQGRSSRTVNGWVFVFLDGTHKTTLFDSHSPGQSSESVLKVAWRLKVLYKNLLMHVPLVHSIRTNLDARRAQLNKEALCCGCIQSDIMYDLAHIRGSHCSLKKFPKKAQKKYSKTPHYETREHLTYLFRVLLGLI